MSPTESPISIRTIAVAALLVLLPLGGSRALAQCEVKAAEFQEITRHLRSLGEKLDDIGRFDQLTEDLPLLDKSINEALGLDRIFGESLGKLGDATTAATLQTALEQAAEKVSAISIDPLTEGGSIVTCEGTVVKIAFDLGVGLSDQKLSVNLEVMEPPVDALISGGKQGVVPVDLGMKFEDLTFRFDASAPATDPERFSLEFNGKPPATVLSVTASGGGVFKANVGFLEVDVAPSVNLALKIEVAFNDPDSDNRISFDEWANTAIEDLLSVALADQAGCATPDPDTPLIVDGSLTLSSLPLVPGDSVIKLRDDCLSDGLAQLTIVWNGIKSFSTITTDTALQGLSVLAATLRSAQVVGDLQIPFMQGGLAYLFSFAEPLSDFLLQASQAAVICGPVNDDPPRGNLLSLPGDVPVYCQALTTEVPKPGSIQWEIQPGGKGSVVLRDAEIIKDTVGPNPSQNAEFMTPREGGLPDVQVSFEDSDGVHTVLRRFISVDELVNQLKKLVFKETNDRVEVGYLEDAGSSGALTLRLKKEFRPVEPGLEPELELDFGDQLKEFTGVAGLGAAAGASARFDPGTVALDVVFGVLLGQVIGGIAEYDPSAPPGTASRFFVKSGGDSLLTVPDLSATVNLDLRGSVGFVDVTAAGNYDLEWHKASVALKTTGQEAEDLISGLASDAIRTRVLLANLEKQLEPSFDVKMSGALDITASIGSNEIHGEIPLSWTIKCGPGTTKEFCLAADAFGKPEIGPVDDDFKGLRALDIDAPIFGSHEGEADSDFLKVSANDTFSVDKLLNSTLRNLTDGSRCVVGRLNVKETGKKIDCVLKGGEENDWDPGDRFEVGGNPRALLSLILDNLDLILGLLEKAGLPGTDGALLDQELPLVARTPRQLLSEIERLEQGLQQFRGLDAPGEIVCSVGDSVPAESDEILRLIDLENEDKFACEIRDLEVSGDLEWSVEGGPVALEGNDSGQTAQFKVSFTQEQLAELPPPVANPSSDLSEPPAVQGQRRSIPFQVRLTVTSDDGLEYPFLYPFPDLSLQRLGDYLACHLGIPAESFDLSLADLPLPDGGEVLPHLVVGLHYGLCTKESPELCGCTKESPELCDPRPPGLLLDQPKAAIRLPLPNGSELIGVEASQGRVALQLRADATLALAFPLESPSDGSTVPVVTIVDSSGLTADFLGVLSADLAANVGPLKLKMTPEGRIAGSIAAAPQRTDGETKTYRLEAFQDALNEGSGFRSLENPPACASVSYTPTKLLTSGVAAAATEEDWLVDTTKTFTADLKGKVLHNTTDGSRCTIDQVVSSKTEDGQDPPEPLDTLICTLAGGNDNRWQKGDTYEVALGDDKILTGTVAEEFDPLVDENPDFAKKVKPKLLEPDMVLRHEKDGSTCRIQQVVASKAGGVLDTLLCRLQGGKTNQWSSGAKYVVEEDDEVRDLDGDVCAALIVTLDAAGAPGVKLGSIGFQIDELRGNVPRKESDDLKTTPGWFVAAPESLFDNVDLRDLDLRLLLAALPVVLDNVGSALESADSVPLIGSGLSEIGGVTTRVNDDFVRPLSDDFLNVLNTRIGKLGDKCDPAASNPKDADCGIVHEVQKQICDQLEANKNKLSAIGLSCPDDIRVRAFCDESSQTECESGDPIDKLQDLRIELRLGESEPSKPDQEGHALDIDFGVPGLPIRLDGKLAINYGWQFLLAFGLDRGLGPYIVVRDGMNPGTGLTLGAHAKVDPTSACGMDFKTARINEIGVDAFNKGSGGCVEGELGFLRTYLFDRDDPSSVRVMAFAGFEGSDSQVPLCQILSGASPAARLTADADLAFAFKTGVNNSAAAELPSVLGTINLEAGWRSDDPPCDNGTLDESDDYNGVCSVGYNHLHLDPGGFVKGVLGPAAEKIREVSQPLKPVIETVRAPLPGVSDLARLTGQPPVTLLTLIEAQSCPKDRKCTRLLRNTLEIIDFADAVLSDFADGDLIDVGAFAVKAAEIRSGAKTPDQAGKLVDYGSPTTQSTKVSAVEVAKNKPGKTRKLPGTLSFPFLDDSSQIFALLMGEDIVLLRYDAGTMRATGGLSRTFFFALGPVPLEVALGGSVTLQGRFAMGYDTSGVRQAITGGSGLAVVDGIFIDDLDLNGCDVPEISLIGRIGASAGVSAGIAAAGIRGGISLTTDLNLDDRPNPDGKLRINEIVNKIHNPLCLFVINGKLDAFLAAWVEVGFEWFSKRWDLEIVRVTLLKFEVECSPPPTRLADTSETAGQTGGSKRSPEPTPTANQLRINVGEKYAERRGLQPTQKNERVTVRQVGDREFEVTGFGLTQAFRIPGTGPIEVRVDAGDGNDDIALEDGVRRSDNGTPGDPSDDFDEIVRFVAKAIVNGGKGNDQIKTGWGADAVDGGPDDDRIQAGAGADVIVGGCGTDNLSGEGGNDTIYGDLQGSASCSAGDGNDVVTGGPGIDTIWGGGGDDSLNGGWAGTQCGVDEYGAGLAPCTGEHPHGAANLCGDGVDNDGDGLIDADDPGCDPLEDPLLDLGDFVYGEGGSDSIEGGFGDDTLFGDFATDKGDANNPCPPGGMTGGNDRINGGPGADTIWGGAGADILGGELGNDFICGGRGNDLIDGDDPEVTSLCDLADTMAAAALGTKLFYDDELYGGDGHDGLWGRTGHDRLFGGAGNDELFGGDCFDDLVGGAGRDFLYGENGNDVLVGDKGNVPGAAVDPPRYTAVELTRRGNADAPPLAPEDPALRFNLANVTREDGTASGGPLDCFLAPEAEMSGGFVPRVGPDGGNADCLFGGDGHDLLFGEAGHDGLYGDNGRDFAEGNSGNDTIRGGKDDDVLYGHRRPEDTARPWTEPASDAEVPSAGNLSDDDSLFGDSGEDHLYGGPGGDLMRGGGEDDYLEGNQDDDEMFGDGGQDDLIGGSSVAGTPDGGDTMFGNREHDVLVGDNAKISRPGHTHPFDPDSPAEVVRHIQLLDVGSNASANLIGAGDTIHGNRGNDRIWGGPGDDLLFGDQGHDALEGNAGNDRMAGGVGQDDLVGGTGRTVVETDKVSPDDRAMASDGLPDGDDILCGGRTATDAFKCDVGDPLRNDFDVLAGDNALIDRLHGSAWERNAFQVGEACAEGDADCEPCRKCGSEDDSSCVDTCNGIRRVVWLFDVEIADPEESGAAIGDGSHGDDELFGQSGEDLMWGQGGNDQLWGGDGDDYMEGNAGNDALHGEGGNDDMVGGTGRINDDPEAGEDGRRDGADVLSGGPGFDIMAGDNAVLVRTLDESGLWIPNGFDGRPRREHRVLRDIDSPRSAEVSGGDRMRGDDHDDFMFGQGGNDEMEGNDGDDLMEGNADNDTMDGGAGQDDMIGGTQQLGVTDRGSSTIPCEWELETELPSVNVLSGDCMTGGSESDVMLGDNGIIVRALADGGETWEVGQESGTVMRAITLFDTISTQDKSLSGDDWMTGGGGDDRMFGQGGADGMSGGDGYDHMEGNHGADTMYGEDGEDDMIGGSSSRDVIGPSSDGDNLADGADFMRGGDEGDVMAGDNARITRSGRIDPNRDDAEREIQLFDVEPAGGLAIGLPTSGSDEMWGEDGDDLMFGQGNDDAWDDDFDGIFSEDPPDGIDNDRDGRESLASTGSDCGDGIDNDGDGSIDRADPDCLVAIDEDAGGDEMHGGPGADYMEGNQGADWMFGDEGEDDMIGGSSAGDGKIGGGVPAAGLADGGDVMKGGGEDDVMAGDNAAITRPLGYDGLWRKLSGGSGYDFVIRKTKMAMAPEPDGAFGHDSMEGDSGHDEIYGQKGNDTLSGCSGDDVLVGDLGRVFTSEQSLNDGSRQREIRSKSPFLADVIFVAGTLYRRTKLFAFQDGDGAEGHDTILGGPGHDSVHGGPGDDLINGDGGLADGCAEAAGGGAASGPSEDHLFGGDGNDVIWGGPGHDHLWGGWGDDHLDVKPRPGIDPAEWLTFGEPDNYQGEDIVHGGWDQDALQADVGGPGPQPGDRLIDWVGAYNVYYVCPGAYGAGYIDRMQGPDVQEFLQLLAESDGALDPAIESTSGFRELGYVFHKENRFNSHPKHPDHPGHFTCGDGVAKQAPPPSEPPEELEGEGKGEKAKPRPRSRP